MCAGGEPNLRYLLINPFCPSSINGINSYFVSAQRVLSSRYDVITFSNDLDEDLNTFRHSVVRFLESNFNKEQVIVEAPETRAATLLVDETWNVHVRLHCPMAVAQKYCGMPIDYARFSDELRAIGKARTVSSPSYGMVRELAEHLDLSKLVINKNPIALKPKFIPQANRDLDVLYMGRFDHLKGQDLLSLILKALPRIYSISIVGKGAEAFGDVGNVVLCREHINDDSRFNILSRAKVVLVPSRFENCSMVILEALAAGVRVVAWDVGGNSEFPDRLVRTVRPWSIEEFSTTIVQEIKDHTVDAHEFSTAIAKINQDYLSGIESVVNRSDTMIPYQSLFSSSGASKLLHL